MLKLSKGGNIGMLELSSMRWNCRHSENVEMLKLSRRWKRRHAETVDMFEMSTFCNCRNGEIVDPVELSAWWKLSSCWNCQQGESVNLVELCYMSSYNNNSCAYSYATSVGTMIYYIKRGVQAKGV